MIRVFSEKNIDKSSVIELWQECFGDSEEYITFFLDTCPHYACIGYFNDADKLISMLFLLDGSLNNQKCMYLYAACTSLNFRKQGIMEKLIEFSKTYVYECGASGIFLVPANEKLYSYYSKFGFVPSFKKKETVISTTESNVIQTNLSYSYDDVVSLKKELCSEFDSFIFDDEIIEYTIKEHLFNGGQIYFNSVSKTIVFYYMNETEVKIKELLTKSHSIVDAVNESFVNNNGKNIYILSPIVYNNINIVENYTKCGMCFSLDSGMKAYLDDHHEIYAGMYLD